MVSSISFPFELFAVKHNKYPPSTGVRAVARREPSTEFHADTGSNKGSFKSFVISLPLRMVLNGSPWFACANPPRIVSNLTTIAYFRPAPPRSYLAPRSTVAP